LNRVAAMAIAGVVTRNLEELATGKATEFHSIRQTGLSTFSSAKRILSTRAQIKTQEILDEQIAEILGFFVGDGAITKSGICLTCGDEEYARNIANRINEALDLRTTVRWDPNETNGRWRIDVHSRELLRFLEAVGINLKDKSRTKKIPSSILRSPKSVMSAFMRGYFDADAYAGKEGIRLSSASEELIRTVQIVLLNYGILSTQRKQQDGCIQLLITSRSAKRFLEEIGFS